MADSSPALTIDDTFYDRFRLAAIVAAIEDDLRQHLKRDVAPWMRAAELFGDRLGEVERRAAVDGVHDPSAELLLDYIDFGDGFALLNGHSGMVEPGLAKTVRGLTPRFESAVGIRNRVMHGRPYRESDEHDLVSLASALESHGAQFPRTAETLRRLKQDQNWTPAVTIQPAAPTGPLTNLPIPEFDETGLVGRDEEIQELIELLTARRRTPVVTVTGEGGIGKTALAVGAVYDLIDRFPDAYRIVLWASLKSERLTGTGIEQIDEAPRDIASLLRELGSVIADDDSLDVQELAAVLDEEPTLVVIDNAESIHPSELLDLTDKLPDASFLFTSRSGLGQLERRLDLGPLRSNSAKHLLRSLAKKRRLNQWSRAGDAQLADVVDRLRRSPLAIRWFVEALVAGAEPEQLLSDQSSLLQFCMATIYDSLDEPAQKVVQCLVAIDDEATIGRLAILTDLPRASVQDSIFELQRRAIIAYGSLHPDHSQTYTLADTAAEYLVKFADPPALAMRAACSARLREIGASEEARRRFDTESALQPFNIVAETPDEQAAASVLRSALRASKAGRLDEARELVDTAVQALPTYFEAYRVGAYIQSRSRPEEASRLYEQAYRLAPPGLRPRVAYWMAGHLANAMRAVDQALPLAQEAHTALHLPETAERLGRMLMYQGAWDEAEELFIQASGTDRARARAIAETDLLDLAKRRVERHTEEHRDPATALTVAACAAQRGLDFARVEVADQRLEHAIVDLYEEAFRAALVLADLGYCEAQLTELLELADRNLAILSRGGADRGWSVLLGNACERDDFPPDLCAYGQKLLVRLAGTGGRLRVDHGEGAVLSFKGEAGYGFIRPSEGDENVFFHVSAMSDPADTFFLTRGVRVVFDYEDSHGQDADRPRAAAIRPMLSPTEKAERMKQRRIVVTRPLPTHAFGEDMLTRTRIFIPRAAVRSQPDWNDLRVGTVLTADIALNERGPFAATRSATVVGDD